MMTNATGATALRGSMRRATSPTRASRCCRQLPKRQVRVGAMMGSDLAHEDIADAARPSSNEADWDHRYGGDQMWSGRPNGSLVVEVEGRPRAVRSTWAPAGEGGDALWLAEQGWDVTASDISGRQALERITAEADRRGLRIECQHVDANARRRSRRRRSTSCRRARVDPSDPGRSRGAQPASTVAPGGMLLVVGHDLAPMRGRIDTSLQSRPFDPDVRVDDVAAALADAPEWDIELLELRPRPAGASSHHVDDVVLRARTRQLIRVQRHVEVSRPERAASARR